MNHQEKKDRHDPLTAENRPGAGHNAEKKRGFFKNLHLELTGKPQHLSILIMLVCLGALWAFMIQSQKKTLEFAQRLNDLETQYNNLKKRKHDLQDLADQQKHFQTQLKEIDSALSDLRASLSKANTDDVSSHPSSMSTKQNFSIEKAQRAALLFELIEELLSEKSINIDDYKQVLPLSIFEQLKHLMDPPLLSHQGLVQAFQSLLPNLFLSKPEKSFFKRALNRLITLRKINSNLDPQTFDAIVYDIEESLHYQSYNRVMEHIKRLPPESQTLLMPLSSAVQQKINLLLLIDKLKSYRQEQVPSTFEPEQ